MKKIFSIALLLVAFAQQHFVHAQNNIPNGSTLSGNPANVVTHPQDYSQVNPSWPIYQDYNYIRVFTPMAPMTSIPAHNQLGSNKINVSTVYMDGWGRPMQKVVQYNPNKYPVYLPYDNRASRSTVGYLPYTISGSNGKLRRDPYSEQTNYYATKHALEGETGYTKTIMQNTSGFQKVLTCAPGEEFAGENRGVTTEMHIGNSATLPTGANTIYNLEYDATNNQICKGPAYSKSEYTVTWTKGQHNSTVFEFTDKTGKLLCKKTRSADVAGYLSTYYIYNELGRLTHIIPPAKSAHFVSNNCLTGIAPSSGPASVFAYDYDDYGQLKKSQTPGKEGFDRVVYDRYQRPFLAQTPAMAADNKAFFTLYDKMGRVVMTGIFDETNNMSQAYYDGIINGTTSLPSYSGTADENKLEYWLLHDMPVNDYPEDQQQEPFLAGCEIHTMNYYDNYSVPPASQANFNPGYQQQYLSGGAAETPTPYRLVHGSLVATKTRIIDNGFNHNWGTREWIDAVFFYDEKGRIIQTHTMNPWKNEWDVQTTQYNFKGQPILNIYDHKGNAQGNKVSGTVIVKKYTYDDYSGQLLTTEQKIDNDAWYVINSFTYDDLGRVNEKGLGNVEYQKYSYNMRGQLTGINDLYVHSLTPTQGAKRTYASILNYETGFDQKRYDGKLTGYKWRTAGYSDVMAYGYNYDDAGRMTHAEYRYLPPTGNHSNPFDWVKTNRDYTVSNLAYDKNGNIQTMKQRGDDNNPTPSPIDIDNLSYTYDASGTRLTGVGDAAGLNVSSAKIHDLEDNNTSGSDFVYDENGNLIEDLNRGVTSIDYNHANQPIEITKGTDGDVKNIYTANGTLLQKVITDNSSGSAVTTTYHYWGPLVYKNNDLEMAMHDEGRTRYDGTDFSYDYFVRDHLGNVRTIVKGTMTYVPLIYDATFELVCSNVEAAIFDQIGEVRDLKPFGTPGDLYSGALNGGVDSERIGAAIVVHAMAGETFNVKGYGYYEETDTQFYNMYPMPEYMLESLSDALVASVPGGEGSTEIIQNLNSLLTSTNYNLYESLKQNATNNNYPRTYLNYLVFDEEFNLRSEYSHVEQLTGAPNQWHLMDVSNGDLEMPINGYLLVYFSNESQMDVAVDALHIINYESTLLEEQHYYPHGMVIEGAQQGGQGIPENQYLFQTNKLQKELDLFINDFNFRQYDAQIGRFMAVDPLAEFSEQERLNPYHFCGNDPANFVDPQGLRAFWLSSPDNGLADGSSFFIMYFDNLQRQTEKVYIPGPIGGRAGFTSSPRNTARPAPGFRILPNRGAIGNAPPLPEISVKAAAQRKKAEDAAMVVKKGEMAATQNEVNSQFLLPPLTQEEIDAYEEQKFKEDWNYILNGLGPTPMTNTAAHRFALLTIRAIFDAPMPEKIDFALSVTPMGLRGPRIPPSISNIKSALRQVHAKLGGPLPKGKPGKFGSPQRGDDIRGYRLDPGHPNRPPGDPESGPHINWWDYSRGKRNRGGISDVVPIDPALPGLR